MSSWHECPRAAFDLETTGRDPLTARIVTASVVLVDGAGRVREHHEWLADPGIPIPEEAAAIHGVSTARARAEGRPGAEVTRELREVLAGLVAADIPLMAFNAVYDFSVLHAECGRHGVDPLAHGAVIDPFILDWRVDRYRKGKRTLTAMSSHYGVRLDQAHTSHADVLATLGVAVQLAERFPQLCIEATDLHDAQIGWAAEKAASLQEYLRRQDPSTIVNGHWPLHGSLLTAAMAG